MKFNTLLPWDTGWTEAGPCEARAGLPDGERASPRKPPGQTSPCTQHLKTAVQSLCLDLSGWAHPGPQAAPPPGSSPSAWALAPGGEPSNTLLPGPLQHAPGKAGAHPPPGAGALPLLCGGGGALTCTFPLISWDPLTCIDLVTGTRPHPLARSTSPAQPGASPLARARDPPPRRRPPICTGPGPPSLAGATPPAQRHPHLREAGLGLGACGTE